MISTTLTRLKGARIPSRKVFYRIDGEGKTVRSVHGPTLAMLLNMWGVRNTQNVDYKHSTSTGPRPQLFMLGLPQLFDLYERAKSVYRSRISKAHTDHGGNHELATTLNVAWDNTERLFRKRGLEI